MQGFEAHGSSVLLLEVRVGALVRHFWLRADDERALVIGSSPAADLRLAEPGVAPVHCHFERVDSKLWLVPTACAGHLRLNGACVLAPCRLSQRSVLGVAGVVVQVRWLAQPGGTLGEPARRDALSDFPAKVGYLWDLPAEHDVTRVDSPTGRHRAENDGGDTCSRAACKLGEATLVYGTPCRHTAAAVPPPCGPPRAWCHWPAAFAQSSGAESGALNGVRRRRLEWVSRLGVATKRRPRRVLGVALGLAVLVAVVTSQLARVARPVAELVPSEALR